MRCPYCGEFVCSGMGVTRFFKCPGCKRSLVVEWTTEEIYLRDRKHQDEELIF